MIQALVRAFTDAIMVWLILCAGVVIVYRPVARRMGWHAWATLGMGVALAGMLALTLTPGGDTNVGCRMTLPHTLGLLQLPRVTHMSLNTLMPMPLGFFGTLAVRRPWICATVMIALPVAIEATQALVTALGRSCSLQDMLNNIVGGLVGVLVGMAVRHLFARRTV
ncbi:MAG TPA: VanZ family protein [Roseiflexaceae bacterium]|nr:VanZ family protein [Roseiflexaceae bacterium]